MVTLTSQVRPQIFLSRVKAPDSRRGQVEGIRGTVAMDTPTLTLCLPRRLLSLAEAVKFLSLVSAPTHPL